MSIFSEIKFVAQDGEQGGNNFRLLMQACLTRPKAIASPPALSLALYVIMQSSIHHNVMYTISRGGR